MHTDASAMSNARLVRSGFIRPDGRLRTYSSTILTSSSIDDTAHCCPSLPAAASPGSGRAIAFPAPSTGLVELPARRRSG
jgi:hypothetical protein